MSLREKPAGLHAALGKYYFIFSWLNIDRQQYRLQAPALGFLHTTQRLFFFSPFFLSFFSFPKSHHSPPTHVFCAHVTMCREDMQAINQQTQQGQFRLDVTFKVLFSLYIQYTSQKYTVNLQRRATRYTREKSASCGGGRFSLMRIIKRESMFVSVLFWIFFFKS